MTMHAVLQDLRHIARSLRRSPAFTGAVVLMFALGVGANATMFGIIDRLLLRPPAHIVEPDGLRRLMVERHDPYTGERTTSDFIAYPDFEDFGRVEALEGVAAYSGRELTLGRGPDARRVNATLAGAAFFPLLGATPALGRFFDATEDRVGAAGVAVIGHALWQRRFGGERTVLGETIDFGYGPYTIVGVAPPDFTGVDLSRVDLWLPLRTAQADIAGPAWQERRTWYWMHAIGRLAPDATAELAATQATTVHRRGRAELVRQGRYDAEASVTAAPLIAARGPLASGESAVALWLAGVSLIVLLIACANVANLLLARSVRRRRATAVWLALGMPRRRLLARTVLESLVLSALGGAAAVLVMHWGGGVVRGLLLPDIAWGEPALAGRALAVAAAVAVMAGTVAGAVPAFQSIRLDLRGALRSESRTATRGASRTRSVLTVVQVALSVILLVGAGLFVRSLDRVESLDLGFDAEDVLFVRPIFERGTDEADQGAVFRRAAERLDRLPGVQHAAAAKGLPFWSLFGLDTHVPGRDSLPTLAGGGPYVHAVGRGYFAALRMRVLRGRGFRAGDDEGAPRVAVVNETMARTLWPDEDALGRCLIIDGEDAPCAEVVGVVGDTRRFSLVDEASAMQYYVPLEQRVLRGRADGLLVRVDGREGMVGAIRREVLGLDGGLRSVEARPYRALIDPRKRSWRLGASMFSLFGLLALGVAGVGLYSVLAFGVARRRREIGIRSALGATPARLIARVLGRGVGLVGVGIALGLLAAVLAAPSIEPLLYGTAPRDPATLGAVVTTLLLAAVLAGYLPARRAARTDPMTVLRTE